MPNPADPTTEPSASPRSDTTPPASPPPAAPASTGGWDGDRSTGRRRRRGADSMALFWGILLLAVGIWFFLRETLGITLPSIRWDAIWPIILIAIGVLVVFRGLRDRGV